MSAVRKLAVGEKVRVVGKVQVARLGTLLFRNAVGPGDLALLVVDDVYVVVVFLAHREALAVLGEVHVFVAAVDREVRRRKLPDDAFVRRHLDQPIVAPVGDHDRIGQRLAPARHRRLAVAGDRWNRRQRDAARDHSRPFGIVEFPADQVGRWRGSGRHARGDQRDRENRTARSPYRFEGSTHPVSVAVRRAATLTAGNDSIARRLPRRTRRTPSRISPDRAETPDGAPWCS